MLNQKLLLWTFCIDCGFACEWLVGVYDFRTDVLVFPWDTWQYFYFLLLSSKQQQFLDSPRVNPSISRMQECCIRRYQRWITGINEPHHDKICLWGFRPGKTQLQRLEISDVETREILLSRQLTTKVLIRLRGCAGWSAPLLFAYSINRFSYDEAQIIWLNFRIVMLIILGQNEIYMCFLFHAKK